MHIFFAFLADSQLIKLCDCTSYDNGFKDAAKLIDSFG